MMKQNPLLVAFSAVVFLGCAGEATAQLFGQRNMGSPLSRRTSPSSQSTRTPASSNVRGRFIDETLESVGTVDENARYIRENRQATDFVGSDLGEARSFVGASQSTELGEVNAVTSAIDDLQIETAPDANLTAQPIVPTRTGMYPPRLTVGFSFKPRPHGEINTKLADRLGSTLSLADSNLIEVLVEGDVATLRGEVASERDRKMAGLLARFEPGIADVRNELTVDQPPAERSRPMAAPAPSDRPKRKARRRK